MITSLFIRIYCRLFFFLGMLLVAVSGVAQQTALPRSFVLTDMEPYGVIVDAERNQLFVSIAELNRIDVYSLDTHVLTDRIAISSPAAMDLTLDGSRLIVGSGGKVNLYAFSGTQFLSVIDPATHKIVNRYAIPNVLGSFEERTNIPDLVVTLAGDLVAIRLGTYDSTQTAFIKLDLNTGAFSPVKIPFAFSVSSLHRVGPTTKVLITEASSSGKFMVYDVATDQVVAQSEFGGYFIWGMASPDGNRIIVPKGPYEVHIFDGQLNELGVGGNQVNIIDGAVFSSDSSRVYIAQDTNGSGVFYEVLDATTAQELGKAPGMFAEHGMAMPVAYDPHGFLVAKTEHGLAFIDATVRSLAGSGPGYYSSNVAPASGPLSGGTAETLNSVRLTAANQVYVGGSPASQIAVQNANVLTFVTPSGQEPGPQDVVIDFLNGWRSYLPQAFTYGPHILYTDMNAGPVSGGTKLRIVGYGFAFTPSQIQVTVGGSTATIDSVNPSSGISPWILPFHSIYVTVPSGSVGTADITVRTPDGTATLNNAFRYYATRSNSSVSATANNVVFDRWHNRVFVSSTSNNTIDVLDAETLARITQVKSVASPYGMSFTPDGTKLVVASSADQLVVLDTETFADFHIPLSFPFAYGRPDSVFPETVAVSANGKALVGVPDLDMLDNSYLVEVDLATGEQKTVDSNVYLLSYLDLRQLENGAKILLTPIGGANMTIWDSVSEKFGEVHQVTSGTDVGVTDDAQVFAMSRAVLDSEFRVTARATTLDYTTPSGTRVWGLNLHPGGSLMFEPHIDSIWVFDMNTGAEIQRINVPGQVSVALSSMTISPDGGTAYLLTHSGLLSVDLNPLPLTVGTVTPNEVPGAHGSTIKIRGSGFREGVNVFVDGEPVTVQFIDGSTLDVTISALAEGPHAVTVKNIDGTSYTKPVALNVYGSQPIIKGITPSQLDAGVGDVTIAVFGLNFPPGSAVAVNGTPVPTMRNTDTDLSAVVSGTMLQSEGSVTLTVAGPDGSVSAPFQASVKFPPGSWGVGTHDLQFGTKHVGDQFSYDFSVSNGGRGPLFDVNIGLDAPAFTQTNDCPSTLMPTQVCTVHLVIDTSVARNADGVLHLTSRSANTDVKLFAGVVPVGPYLQIFSVSADNEGWLGDQVWGGIRLVALDQSVAVTAVRTSDPGVTISNNCTTVTTSICEIGFSYVPTSVSKKDVTVTIESDASNSLMIAVLHFTGVFPLRFIPEQYNIGQLLVGNPITGGVSLQNYSHGYIGKFQISTTGPINAISHCGDTVAPNSNCWLDITVNPTGIGSLSGVAKVVTPEDTAQLLISATVRDFSLQSTGGSSPSLTLNAGQTGTTALEVVPLGGFTGNIQLSCSSNIPAGSCSLNPGYLTIDSSGAHFASTLKVTTTKRTLSHAAPMQRGPILAFKMSMFGCGVLLIGLVGRRGSHLLVVLCAMSLLTIISCGGGGGNSGVTNPPPIETGTPSGTYTVTVIATYSPVTRSIPVSVKVQ
jgi:YVTN family beta-propeller protein